MKLLIDINHPAHVHLFRHAIHAWQKDGHQVIITARDKEVTTRLLDFYGLTYSLTTHPSHSLAGKAWELLRQDSIIYQLAVRHHIELMLGTSIGITHVSRITSAKSLFFNEDDAAVDRTSYYLAYPFADAIITPDCLSDIITSKYFTYPSYHELAYLHPNRFQPDPSIFSLLGISANESYFVLRLVALKADHDLGQKGISPSFQRRLIYFLSDYGRVFITSEAPLPQDLEPYRVPVPAHKMHDVLAFASMLISDSQTMTAEAAVLGIPAIRCNTFIHRISYLDELEQRYGLTYGFLPHAEDAMLEKIVSLLKDKSTKEQWSEKRERMLKEKIDLTAWMLDFISTYHQKHFG